MEKRIEKPEEKKEREREKGGEKSLCKKETPNVRDDKTVLELMRDL